MNTVAVALVSTKGGVTKTTTAANLAAILTDLGQRVLLIDLDKQSSLSSHYSLVYRAQYGVLKVVKSGDLNDAISTASLWGDQTIDLVVSDDQQGKLYDWIRDTPDGRARLKHALNDAPYDFVIIDTPGTDGPLQDVGVLAADFLISPIPPDALSAREFGRGTVAMLKRLEPMAALGCPVGPLFGLIARMDKTRDARVIAEHLREESFTASKAKIRILETVIPHRVCYKESASVQTPVHLHDRTAKQTMHELVKELFPHLGKKRFISDRIALTTSKKIPHKVAAHG